MSGLAALLGGLGLVAVGFGLLSALVAIFQPVGDLAWIVGNLALGVILLSLSLFMSFDTVRARLRSAEGRRAGRHGTSSLLSTFAWIVILGLLGFLASRHSLRFDWSESRVNTLSEQSLALLAELPGEVTLTAFFHQQAAPEASDLLARYAHASDRVRIDYVDPNVVPGLVEDLRLDPEALARGLARIELAGQAVVVTEFSESALTNALLKLVRGSNKKVYFSDGHNERLIRAEDDEPASGKETLGRAAEALRNETFAVESLALASRGEVPQDADVVVIAGPTRPFLEHEIEALRAYAARGGALLVMIDPRAQTNLYTLLEEWGVLLGDDVVVDQSLALFGQATSPIAGGYAPAHPITQGLRETTLFPMVRSVDVREGAGGWAYERLVLTSKESWAERDLDGWRKTGRAVLGAEDLPGPVPIALAGSPHAGTDADARESRLVVFGDADFVSNEFVDSFRNRDLFLNSVQWLMGDVSQISLRPHTSRASRFQMDALQFRRLQYLSLFVLPEGIAVLGVFAWWRRRDASGA